MFFKNTISTKKHSFRYKADGVLEEVALTDLQAVRIASPACDLSSLLFTSLDGAVRKENLDAFLASYHASFADVLEAGGKPVPFTLEEL